MSRISCGVRERRLALTALCLAAAAPVGPAPAADPGDVASAPTALRERVPEGTIVPLAVDPTPGVPLTLAVPIAGELVTLDLLPHSVRSASYQVLVQVDGGSVVAIEPGPVRTLRGVVVERPGSFVAASLVEGGIEAMIDVPEMDGRYWIEPLAEEGPGAHIVYHDEQVLGSDGVCGYEEGRHDPIGDDPPQAGPPAGGEGGVAGGECYWFAELAVDADYEYFDLWGGSTANVENQINSIVNTVNDQYEQDVAISHQLGTIIIRTSAVDPYSSTTSASNLLNEFRTFWNLHHDDISRDVAQMFTGRDLNDDVIGIGYSANICTSNAYSLVQHVSFGGNPFSCRTDLSAHELGHNWGANHCACSSYTMNPGLTCSNRFHPTLTIPEIVSYRNSSSPCLVFDCIPANDECADAIDIVDGTITFTTQLASTDGPADNLCNVNGQSQVDRDVWYRYHSECEGEVSVDVCSSNFNTRLAVYESFCPATVNQAIACNDDSCGTRSELTFVASAGTDYLIRIGGTNDFTGIGLLSVAGPSCIPPPANDSCGSATTISPGSVEFTTLGATSAGPDESGDCGPAVENDVWFRFLAPCDGTALVGVCDSTFDTAIAAYGAACPGADGTAIACNDDVCGEQSVMSFPVTAGTLYRIRVGGAGGATGTGVLALACGDPQDCNGNGVADDQEIAEGAPDCNDNGVPDECDIDGGASADENGNRIPDECESSCPTDVDGNGATDVDDLVTVILAWGQDDPDADIDGSGTVDVDDLVAVILAWGPCD